MYNKIVITFFAIFLISTITAKATNYYVSPIGSNANNGTFAQPFQSVQYALNTANMGGDTVFVRQGTYFEKLNFPHSGSATASIVLTNYSNEIVQIDATTTPLSVGIFVKINGKSHITIRGIRFQNFLDRLAKSAGLAIIGGGENIKILNCLFRDFTTLDVPTSNFEMKGIAVFSTQNQPLSNIVISGNRFERIATGQSEVITVNGDVHNFEISHNEATQCATNPIFQCAGGYNIEFAEGFRTDSLAVPTNGVFSHNHIHDNTEGYGPKAIYIDGGEDMLIENNLIVNNAVGIGVAVEEIRAEAVRRITIRNNVLHDNFFGVSIGNDPLIQPDRPPGSVDSVFLINNTIVKSWRPIEAGQSDVQNLFFYNNIFWQEYGAFNDPVIFCFNSIIPNFVLNNNLYFTGDGISNKFRYNNITYENLANFRAATNNENNGLYANPIFTDYNNQNFSIQAGSPAINAANVQYAPPKDYLGMLRPIGNAPDIGAYEYCTTFVPIIMGNATTCSNQIQTYQIDAVVNATYNWTITNGTIISGQGTPTISVQWTSAGIGSVAVEILF